MKILITLRNILVAAFFLLFFSNDAKAIIEITSIPCICSGDGPNSVTILLSVTPSPGMQSAGPFTFVWTGPNGFHSTVQSPNSVTEPGLYEVTVTNAYGCKTVLSANVQNCTPDPVIAIEGSTCICSPGSNGTINLVTDPAGGPYTFQWSGPGGYTSQVEDPSNVTLPGFYTVTATNSHGCKVVESTPMVFCDEIYPYIKKVSVRALIGGNNGPIIYTGEWNQQGNCISYTMNSTPLSSSYNWADVGLKIDVFASRELASLTIELPGLIPSSSNGSGTNTNIWSFNFPVGVLTNLIGTSPASQQIIFNGIDIYGKPILDLRAMSNELTECVEIPQLQNSCSWPNGTSPQTGTLGMDDVHIFEIGCILVDIDIPSPAGTNGFVLAYIEGNALPITVSWIGPNMMPYSTTVYTSPATIALPYNSPGTYKITLTGSGNCTAKKIVIIPSCPIPFQVDVESLSPACPGTNNGSICVEARVPPNTPMMTNPQFNYSWPIGTNVSQNGNVSCANNLANGTYCVTVTEAVCNFVTIRCINLNYSSTINTSGTITSSCGNQPIGMVKVNIVGGGKAPFSYIWSNANGNVGSNTISGLSSGWYCVTITDACATTKVDCFFVPPFNDDNIIDVYANIQYVCVDGYVNSYDDNTLGSITLLTSGTALPFTYLWENGSTKKDRFGLSAGTYSVTVTDNCGKSIVKTYVVGEYNTPILSNSGLGINPDCGMNSGSLLINALTLPTNTIPQIHNFSWSNGANTDDIFNLHFGAYTVTVTNEWTGCSHRQGFVVANGMVSFDQIIEDAIVLSSTESGSCGSIDLTMPANYNVIGWSTGSNLEDINGLSSGTYFVTVSNSYGCTGIASFVVNEEEFQIETAGIGPTGGPNGGGYVDIEMTGAFAPFSYQWSNGGIQQDIYNVPTGSYTVTVTDARGCTKTKQFYVGTGCQNATPISLTSDVVPLTTDGGIDGTITVAITGGIFPYWVTFEGPNNTLYYSVGTSIWTFSDLAEGDYYITVTDGCSSATTWRPVRFCGSYEIEIEGDVTDICPFAGNCFSAGAIDLTVTGAINPSGFDWYYLGSYGCDNPANLWDHTTVPYLHSLTLAGRYRVITTDYANCKVEECYYVRKNITISPVSWNLNNSCYANLLCSDCVVDQLIESPIVEIINESDCTARLRCPIDGSYSEFTIQGQMFWSDVSSNIGGIGCHADRYCHFDLPEDVNVPISSIAEPCCPITSNGTGCNEVEDSDCDCIPNSWDEDPDDACVPSLNDPKCDTDNDGDNDSNDNCPTVPNGGQEDLDEDEVGDACDNCRFHENSDQLDSDMDGIGDACDNCIDEFNTNQLDTDEDGIGNVCDNCPTSPNPSQSDCDGDGNGDICDDDVDSDMDGVSDCVDDCDEVFDPIQGLDCDGNGIVDCIEGGIYDTDADGIGNGCDNCPDIFNVGQIDTDNDLIGDACDEYAPPPLFPFTNEPVGSRGAKNQQSSKIANEPVGSREAKNQQSSKNRLVENFGFKVYPNPIQTSNMYIDYFSENEGEAIVYIFNNLGESLLRKEVSLNFGRNLFDIDIKHLARHQIVHVSLVNSIGFRLSETIIIY